MAWDAFVFVGDLCISTQCIGLLGLLGALCAFVIRVFFSVRSNKGLVMGSVKALCSSLRWKLNSDSSTDHLQHELLLSSFNCGIRNFKELKRQHSCWLIFVRCHLLLYSVSLLEFRGPKCQLKQSKVPPCCTGAVGIALNLLRCL